MLTAKDIEVNHGPWRQIENANYGTTFQCLSHGERRYYNAGEGGAGGWEWVPGQGPVDRSVPVQPVVPTSPPVPVQPSPAPIWMLPPGDNPALVTPPELLEPFPERPEYFEPAPGGGSRDPSSGGWDWGNFVPPFLKPDEGDTGVGKWLDPFFPGDQDSGFDFLFPGNFDEGIGNMFSNPLMLMLLLSSRRD